MKPKTIKILYWVLTILFALAMLGDAYGGLTRQKDGVDVLVHLGYPLYLLPLSGIAKVLGVIAILQTRFTAIKEWAFSGFVISFILAFGSRAYVADPISQMIPPLVMLGYTLLTYYFWKKFAQLKAG